MAKTCYRDCWWLIQAVAGEFGTGSFRNGTGYTMRELNDLRFMANRLTWKPYHGYDEDRNEDDEEYRRDKEKFRKDVNNWKTLIYNEFGLIITKGSTSGPDHHGNGGIYYYLANPDLLNKGGKSLRDHIKFLAESETRRDNWVSVQEMTDLYKSGSLSMGFISAGGSVSYGYLSSTNTTPRTILGEENLALVQFAMKFGEVLTIKYGKVTTGIDINAPCSFEPYQVKEIEGRWYAIGNLYPMGHKESAELAVYDLARLEFAYDEENPDVFYEPIKDFEINNYIALNQACRRKLGKVIVAGITVSDGELFTQLTKYPLCSAQEIPEPEQISKFGSHLFVYANLSYNLIAQFGAYGDEISFKIYSTLAGYIDDEELIEEDERCITKALNYFRNTEEMRESK